MSSLARSPFVVVSLAGLLFAGCSSEPAQLADAMPPNGDFPQELHTEGNRIVDPDGNAIVLRGVNALDPLAQKTFGEPSLGTWDKSYYATIAEWGATLVRIPIHPDSWRTDPEQALEIIDQTVKWIGELGMYAVIDCHSIGMITTGVFETEAYVLTPQELKDYWQTIASHFKDNDVVAFYDIFNEPVNLARVAAEGQDNAADWHEWKLFAEEVIDVIRAEDPDSVVVVGGMYWSYDLSHVGADPVERDNVVYGVHPYPGSIDRMPWQDAFGDTADQYPVLALELGFTDKQTRESIVVTFPELADELDPDAFNDAYLETSYTEGVYRDDIVAFFRDKGMGWTAWSFSPVWGPILFKNWDYEPTEAGAFFKSQF